MGEADESYEFWVAGGMAETVQQDAVGRNEEAVEEDEVQCVAMWCACPDCKLAALHADGGPPVEMVSDADAEDRYTAERIMYFVVFSCF